MVTRRFAVLALVPLLAAVPAWATAPDDAWPACVEPRSTGAPADHDFTVDACIGQIRPGAPMTSPAGCTLNFVFTDAAGALYVGSAGHCVGAVGQRVSTSIVGDFGSVVYRRVQGSNDFALIKVDADKHHLVNPTLCTWGGPLADDPGSTLARDVLLEYGWGVATQWTSVTRARAHVATLLDANSVEWTGLGSGGDSGAPVVNQAGYAVAIHTYGFTPVVGVALEGGPSIAAVLAMGRTAVPTLELVPGDPTGLENALRDLTYDD